jgi:pimeloyl-ACP methyl ester carboxylesterase
MGKSLEEIPEPDREWCKNSLASGDAEQGKPPQEAKLSFYGASYGTAIGTTFGMMFPDRIDRMLLDGVVDVASHYKAQRQVDPLDPLDVFDHFAPLCLRAGPERCAFHGGNQTVEAIEARIVAIFRKLEESNAVPPSISSLSRDWLAFPF